MTPQERSLLESFVAQLIQVRGVNKDPEAERLIAQAVEQQPDATYLVVQRALLLGQALDQAKARIAALEQSAGGRDQGFLDPNASGWGAAGGPSSSPASGPPGYRGQGAGVGAVYGSPASRAPVYGAPAYGAPTYGAPPAGGAFSGFLGQAAATAAGVAGGEFLFQGIENLFGHHGGGGFGAGGGFGNGFSGGGFGSGFEAVPTEDVTINNYYGPEEVNVENDFNQPLPDDSPLTDDSDATFTNDDFVDDQDIV
jgi:uncharacterized protein